MALVLGCSTRTAPPPVEEPEPSTENRAGADPATAPDADKVSSCAAPPVTEDEAATAFAEAASMDARVKSGELDRKLSWDDRYKLYDRAARGGHRDAQARAGAMMFATMFTTEEPGPADRPVYVEAMTRLIIAARRGSTDAAKFMPGMEALMFGQVPDVVEPPLSSIPKAWIEDSLAAADRWIRCHAADAAAQK